MHFPPPWCIQSLFSQWHELSSHSTHILQWNQHKNQFKNYFVAWEEVVWSDVRRPYVGKFAQHLQAQRTGILTKESNWSPKPLFDPLKAKSCLQIGLSQAEGECSASAPSSSFQVIFTTVFWQGFPKRSYFSSHCSCYCCRGKVCVTDPIQPQDFYTSLSFSHWSKALGWGKKSTWIYSD